MADQIAIRIAESIVNEGSAVSAQVAFRTRSSATASAPASVRWRVDCLTTKQAIVEWTSASAASSVTITVPGTSNGIVNDDNNFEERQLTVEIDTNLSTQAKASKTWRVRNIQTYDGLFEWPPGLPNLEPYFPITQAEQDAGVTPTRYQYPEGQVDRYGAAGNGVTDDTLAFRAAVSVAAAGGGGKITCRPGVTYLLSTTNTHSVVVPIAAANYTDLTQDYAYNVLLDGLDNIEFDFRGATIYSDDSGGAIFMLDSCRNIAFRNGKLQSVHTHNATTGADIVVGMHPIACTSQDRNSFGITLENLDVSNALSYIYCFGTSSSTYRIRGVKARNINVNHCRHGAPLHENGDGFDGDGIHCSGVLRDFFIFGANDGRLRMTADTGVDGFRALVKAYRNDTKNWYIKYTSTKTVTATAQVGVESDYDTDTQATPKKVLNVELDIDNSAADSTLDAAVAFAIYENTVIVNSSTQVFHGIKLRGIHTAPPDIASFMNTADGGSLDTDGVVLLSGSMSSIYDATGYYDPKQRRVTFTGVLKINGSATGITFSTNACEYWRDGRFVEATYNLVLSSKGAGAGVVTIDVPITSSLINVAPAHILCLGSANMSGLTGPIVGYVSLNSDSINLQQQGAAATAPLGDSNLTNTSNILLHVRYPIW